MEITGTSESDAFDINLLCFWYIPVETFAQEPIKVSSQTFWTGDIFQTFFRPAENKNYGDRVNLSCMKNIDKL